MYQEECSDDTKGLQVLKPMRQSHGSPTGPRRENQPALVNECHEGNIALLRKPEMPRKWETENSLKVQPPVVWSPVHPIRGKARVRECIELKLIQRNTHNPCKCQKERGVFQIKTELCLKSGKFNLFSFLLFVCKMVRAFHDVYDEHAPRNNERKQEWDNSEHISINQACKPDWYDISIYINVD